MLNSSIHNDEFNAIHYSKSIQNQNLLEQSKIDHENQSNDNEGTNPILVKGPFKKHKDELIEENNLRLSLTPEKNPTKQDKKVRFKEEDEVFRPSCELFTVNADEATNSNYRIPNKRIQSVTPLGSMERPDFEDALRRVAVVLHQHIVTCVKRWNRATPDTYEVGQFHRSKMTEFAEDNFITPKYKYTFVRLPMAVPGVCYRMEKIKQEYPEPSAAEIYDFMVTLFRKARLSSECSIVSLIYVERLMQRAHVPIMPTTWRPIVLCGLLLASKVWQDYSSWNVEFSIIYPQYSLRAINRLERLFVANIQWQLGIKSSEYAKYYFALRSMTEKRDFRARYNYMIQVAPPTKAQAIEQRSEAVENFILSQSL